MSVWKSEAGLSRGKAGSWLVLDDAPSIRRINDTVGHYVVLRIMVFLSPVVAVKSGTAY